MELKFGEVVLLKFPFTDKKKSKKRPALVLFDAGDEDVILCRITSQEVKTKFDFSISVWQEAGLLVESYIRLHKIATLEKKLVEKKLGELSRKDKQGLKRRIKDIFEKDFLSKR